MLKLILELKRHLKSEFSKNVATLFTGSVVAQAIPLLASLVLSRLYTPEDFAINEVFLRLYSIGLVFSTLRYEQAIVLPKENSKAAHIIFLILKISLITGLFFLVFNLFFGKWIEDAQGIPNLYYYLLLIPVALVVSSNYQALNYWAVRNKNYKQLSVTKSTVSFTNSGYRLIVGALTSGHPIGLVSSMILSQFVGALILLKGNLKSFITFSKDRDKGDILKIAKEYDDFPKVNTLHALLDAIREATIIYLIIHFFGDTTLGLYAFTVRIMKLPLGMIGTSIGQVFFQKAAEVVNQKKSVYEITLKTIKKLTIISLPIFILIGLLSDWAFEFVFGDKWSDAGFIAQIITPWMFFNFLNSPLSQIPLILKKQKEVFFISIIGFVVSVLGLICGGLYLKDVYNSLILFSIIQSCYLLFVLLWILKIAKRYDKANLTVE